MKVRIEIANPQLLRRVLDEMSERFAQRIQEAVEREMRQMFKPLRRSTPGRRRSRRKRSR